MSTTNRQWVLAQRPEGIPDENTFELREIQSPTLEDGQVRVRVDYFTLDPGSRPGLTRASYVPMHPIGTVMMSAGVGTVIESKHQKFAKDDCVTGALGWRDGGVFPGKTLVKLDPNIFPTVIPVTSALGVLGIPGLTAYFGLLKIAEVKPGETVLISSASGTVGSVAGQVARLHEAKSVGIAGSNAKIDWLLSEARFDHAINYQEVDDLSASIAEACPDGVDVYLDNVGGPTLDAAIENMNRNGRIVISGQISEYNREEPLGIRNTLEFINRRIKMEGFVVLDYAREFAAAQAQLAQWVLAKDIVIREEIIDGIENAPKAYAELFTGESFGRRLVRVQH